MSTAFPFWCVCHGRFCSGLLFSDSVGWTGSSSLLVSLQWERLEGLSVICHVMWKLFLKVMSFGVRLAECCKASTGRSAARPWTDSSSLLVSLQWERLEGLSSICSPRSLKTIPCGETIYQAFCLYTSSLLRCHCASPPYFIVPPSHEVDFFACIPSMRGWC